MTLRENLRRSQMPNSTNHPTHLHTLIVSRIQSGARLPRQPTAFGSRSYSAIGRVFLAQRVNNVADKIPKIAQIHRSSYFPAWATTANERVSLVHVFSRRCGVRSIDGIAAVA